MGNGQSSTSLSGNENCIQGSITTDHGGGTSTTATGQINTGGLAGGVTVSQQISDSTTVSGSIDTGGNTGVKVEVDF